MRAVSRSKYGNKKTVIDNITFDSLLEAKRYRELKLLQKAGEISGLEVHPRFVCTINDVRICTYVGDFSYSRKSGWPDNRVVEDVKGVRTPAFVLKKKLLKALYEIDVVEIKK